MLFLLLFVYSGQRSIFTIQINRSILKSGAPIVFMPFRRAPKPKCGAVATSTRLNTGLRKQAPKKQIVPAKKPVIKKNNIAKKTSVVNTSVSKNKAVQSKKPVEVKEQVVQKKIVEPPVKKKIVPEQKKPMEKKVVTKEVVPEKLDHMPKKEQKVLPQNVQEKNVVKPLAKPAEKKEVVPDQQLVQNQAEVTANTSLDQELGEQNNVIYIGQQEIEALKVEHEIEREVEKHWRPPAGLSKDLSCTVQVVVDWSGIVKQSQITKTSGVLIYDISARMAVSKLKLPEVLKGKEVSIVFNQ